MGHTATNPAAAHGSGMGWWRHARTGDGASASGLSFLDLRFLLCLVILAAVTLSADLTLPLGHSGGLLHLAVVLLGWWLARPAHIAVLAVVASALVLMGLGLGFAHEGLVITGVATTPNEALMARLLALGAIWAVAAVLIAARRRERNLARALHGAIPSASRRPSPPSAERRHPDMPACGARDDRRRRADLAALHHELRTPLNAIIGFSEIARREMLGPIGNDRYREYMADINVSGYQLLAMIDALLAEREEQLARGGHAPAHPESAAQAPRRAAGS